MKRMIICMIAAAAAFSLTAFTAPPAARDQTYYFRYNNQWHIYDGLDACEPGSTFACEVDNPLTVFVDPTWLYVTQFQADIYLLKFDY